MYADDDDQGARFRPEHFKAVILARMTELDLTNDTVSRAGGPSTTKMSSIRRPDPDPPRSDIYRKLDKALKWKAGSARIVSLGGDPVPLPEERMDQGGDPVRHAIANSPLLRPAAKEMLLKVYDMELERERAAADDRRSG